MQIVINKSMAEMLEEQLEKSFPGKKNYGKLVKIKRADKNGIMRTVFIDPTKDLYQNKMKIKKREQDIAKLPKFSKGKTLAVRIGGNDVIGTLIKQDSSHVYLNTDNGVISVLYKNIYSGNQAEEKILQENTKLGLFKVTEWPKESKKFKNGEKGLQPSTDIKEVYTLAEKDHQALVNNVHQVGKMFGLPSNLIVTRPSLKKEKRAKEKLMGDYNAEMLQSGISDIYDPKTDTYNASTLRDVDGATLAFNSMRDLYKALNHYNGSKEIIRVKNNFAPANAMGYSDINMNIRLPNGSVSEIQLNTVANIVAKETYGHALYEVARTEAIKTKPEYKELSDILVQAQKELYGKAAEFSKKENFPDLEGKSPFGYMDGTTFKHVTNETYSSIVKPYTDKAKAMVETAYAKKDIGEETYKHFNELLAII